MDHPPANPPANAVALDATLGSIDGAPPVPTQAPVVSVTGAMSSAQRIGRYAVLRELGQGSMGLVIAAYDEELDRRVAVKLLHDTRPASAEHRIRILREAQAMARVSHPNVVQVYEVGELGKSGSTGSQVYIAMEFIDGQTLADWQQQQHPWEETLQVYIATGQGLLAAHQAGLIHRDFKPDNVLLGADGRPRVADFGLARSGDERGALSTAPAAPIQTPSRSSGHLQTRLTQEGTMMGTPVYMPPEQYLGTVADSRSDQFSFCAALYEALYRVLPFQGDTIETLGANVLSGRLRPPPANSPVPPPVQAAILRGLATDPEQRFPSMKELLAALSFNPALDPAASPLSRRAFSFSLLLTGLLLVAIFLRPTLRNQNTVGMAVVSSLILFFGAGVATLLLRKTLLRNSFHRGIVLLILILCGQESLISGLAYLTGMTVAQTVAMELVALVALVVSLTYFFFGRGWLGLPLILLATVWVVYQPADAGLIAMLIHLLFAAAAIALWSRSADASVSASTTATAQRRRQADLRL
jgi:serine/threonine protein kinase